MTEEIKRGIPAPSSLVIGAAIIWLFFGVLFGVLSAVYAGQVHRPRSERPRADRHLAARLLGRAVLLYYLTYKVRCSRPAATRS